MTVGQASDTWLQSLLLLVLAPATADQIVNGRNLTIDASVDSDLSLFAKGKLLDYLVVTSSIRRVQFFDCIILTSVWLVKLSLTVDCGHHQFSASLDVLRAPPD